MRYARTLLFLLLELPVSVCAQPFPQDRDVIGDRGDPGVQQPPVVVVTSILAAPDTTARWSWRGQVGVHWTEGAKDVVRVYRYGVDLYGQRALGGSTHALATVVLLSDPNQGIESQLNMGRGATLRRLIICWRTS